MADEIDFASRYADKLLPTNAGGSWRQREQAIRDEVLAGPDETVAGFAWHFNDLYTRNIKSYLANGDYAQAKKYYDDVQYAIEANHADLLTISQVTDTGHYADQLAKRAASILDGAFNQEKVTLKDGTETTIGQALSDGSPFLSDKSRELQNMQFSPQAIQLYMANDPAIRSVMDGFLRTAHGEGRGGIDAMPNRIQMQALAEAYADDADRINEVFGDGTGRFLDYIRETHKTSGAAAQTMQTLVDFAESYAQATGKSGHALAMDVVGGYNDLVTSVFRGTAQKKAAGGRANAVPAEVTDDQRRTFDAAFIPAMKEAMARVGGPFDLHDPRLRQSMLEVMDTVAYTSALGGDLFASGRGAGLALNQMFGSYVAEAMTGQTHMPDNIVTAIRRVRGQLSQRLTGGRDLARVTADLTGRDTDYLANLDKVNETKSTSPEADALAAEVHAAVALSVIDGIANGQSASDSFFRYAQSPAAVQDLTARLVGAFHGKGRDVLAQALATEVVRGLASGDQVNMEELIADFAFGERSRTLPSVARDTARMWYHGNVANQVQFARHKTQLRDKYLSEGYTDAQARRAVSVVSEQASRELAAGGDPLAVFDAALDVGEYFTTEYTESVDGKGKKVAVPKVVVRTGPRSKAGVLYGQASVPPGTFTGNRAVWDAVQMSLRRDYERQDKLGEYVERERAREQVKQEMADVM